MSPTVTPLLIIDVYGSRLYISQEHFEDPKRNQIPICRKDGLKRSYTKAGGKDGLNTIHRENIRKVYRS